MSDPFRVFEPIDQPLSDEHSVLVAFRALPDVAKQRALVESKIPAASILHFDHENDLLERWEQMAERDEDDEPGTLLCIWMSRWVVLHIDFGSPTTDDRIDDGFMAYIREAHAVDPVAEAVLLTGVPAQMGDVGTDPNLPSPVPVLESWVSETPFGNLYAPA